MKEYLPNLLCFIYGIFHKSEEETKAMIENPHQGTHCVGYHVYPLKHIVNINVDISPIQKITTMQLNIKTTKNVLQFQTECI